MCWFSARASWFWSWSHRVMQSIDWFNFPMLTKMPYLSWPYLLTFGPYPLRFHIQILSDFLPLIVVNLAVPQCLQSIVLQTEPPHEIQYAWDTQLQVNCNIIISSSTAPGAPRPGDSFYIGDWSGHGRCPGIPIRHAGLRSSDVPHLWVADFQSLLAAVPIKPLFPLATSALETKPQLLK